MEPISVSAAFAWSMGVGLVTGGIAFGTAKSQIGDLKKDHEEIRQELVAHKKDDLQTHRDLLDSSARTEAKLDMVLEELRRRP